MPRYCFCEAGGHAVVVPADAVSQALHVRCPDCKRIVQVTSVLLSDGLLHWMPGDWRPGAVDSPYDLGLFIYN